MTKRNARKKAEELSAPGPGSLKGEVVEQKKEEEKEQHFCKDCKSYDKSTEREFHRKVGPRNDKGERTEIVETRAVCMNPKASSYRHLVMAEYAKRQCPMWNEGIYEQPAKPEEKPTKETQKPSKKKHKKDESKDDSNETIEKVEKAFREGAEEVTLSSNGTMKTVPVVQNFSIMGAARSYTSPGVVNIKFDPSKAGYVHFNVTLPTLGTQSFAFQQSLQNFTYAFAALPVSGAQTCTLTLVSQGAS
jgi:hypothetical protein